LWQAQSWDVNLIGNIRRSENEQKRITAMGLATALISRKKFSFLLNKLTGMNDLFLFFQLWTDALIYLGSTETLAFFSQFVELCGIYGRTIQVNIAWPLILKSIGDVFSLSRSLQNPTISKKKPLQLDLLVWL
jgi:hypothetical protein